MITISITALGVLGLAWIAYPAILQLWRIPSRPSANVGPSRLSVLIVTRDDPEVVVRRIDNLRSSRGIEFEEIIVVIDWNARERIHEFRDALDSEVRVLAGDPPGGKAAGLNAGLRAASTDWVLLADSWQSFEKDAVQKLLEGIRNERTAAVSGRVRHDHDDPVMRLYWRYENAIRTAQSARHSLVTTSGAIAIVNRTAVRPLPSHAICDDLFITLDLAMRGYRVAYVPDAVARDPRRLTRRQTFQKKVRTLTGLWQLLAWKPEVLFPARNPILVDFLCHKLARLLTPYLLLVLIVMTTAAVLRITSAELLGLAVGAATILTLLAFLVFPRVIRPALSSIVWMATLLLAPVLATHNALRREWGVWHPHGQEDDSAVRQTRSSRDLEAVRDETPIV